jgi:hypothetical protein
VLRLLRDACTDGKEAIVAACLDRIDFSLVRDAATRHEALVRASRAGHGSIVARLLAAIDGIDPFFGTGSMACAVFAAIQNKHIGVCEQLLAVVGESVVTLLRGADDAEFDQTALGMALLVAKHEPTAVRLLQLCGVTDRALPIAIRAALIAGLNDFAVDLLQRSSSLPIANDDTWVEWFKLAIEFCDARPLQYILEHDGHAIDVCASHNQFDGKTVGANFAFTFAAYRGRTDMLALLLPRAGNKLREALEAALRIGVRGAHEGVIRALLQHPAASVPSNVGSFLTVRLTATVALLLDSQLVLERCNWTEALQCCFTRSFGEPLGDTVDALNAVVLILDRAGDRVANINAVSHYFHPLKWALQHHHTALFESVLRHPSFKMTAEDAQKVLVQIAFNNDALTLRRVLSDERIEIDFCRRPLFQFRPQRPQVPPTSCRLDALLTAVEVAVELCRYELLALMLADARFDPSGDRNALLRMLCGLLHSIELHNKCLWLVGGFSIVSVDWSREQNAAQPRVIQSSVPDGGRVLSLVDAVLHHRCFRAEPGDFPRDHGSLTAIVGELCGAKLHKQLNKHELPPPTVRAGRWNAPPVPSPASKLELIRALLDGSDSVRVELLDASTVDDATIRQLLSRRRRQYT